MLHCHVASPSTLKGFLELDTEDNIAEALRTANDDGYTPFTEALHEGNEESAFLLLKRSGQIREAWQSPLPILSLAAKANAALVFETLLDLGAEVRSETSAVDTPLHHLAVNASIDFVNRLKSLYPHACLSYSDGKTPLDAFLWNCLCYDNRPPAFNIALIDTLSEYGPLASEAKEKRLAWESFALKSLQHARGLRKHQALQDQDRQEVLTSLATRLLQLGFMESYENVARQSGLLTLLEFSGDNFKYLDEAWPVPSTTIYEAMKRTQYWKSLSISPLAVRLLKAAIVSNIAKLVKFLLEKGVDVHQRIDDLSPLEKACQIPSSSKESNESKTIFLLLLGYADKSHLNELNPLGSQFGLIHSLANNSKEWEMRELLKNGADPNILTGNDTQHSALHTSISVGSLSIARILLEKGADPTLAASQGHDATLGAASLGKVSFLSFFHGLENQPWQINWQNTVKELCFSTRKAGVTSIQGLNALHISAFYGHVSSLKFYIDHEILTDLDMACDDNRYTPMHLAAMNGKLDVVKFLRDGHADINARTVNRKLPLHLAVAYGWLEVVRELLDAGSDTTEDSSKMTPFMLACELRNQPIIDCLRQAGKQNSEVVPSRVYKRGLAQLLEIAISNGNLQLCEGLKNEGCDLDIDIPRWGNISPLILAIVCQRPNIINWLLENRVCTMDSRYYKGNATSAFHEIIKIPKLNDILPVFLESYMNDGGYILDESSDLVGTAVRARNWTGLRLLLEHIKGNAENYG